MLSEHLFHQLQEDGVIGAGGYIKFEMLGIKTTVKTKSVVGDVIQDWLTNYLRSKGIAFASPEHTQQFPDFYLTGAEPREFLEVKCFDGKKSPNFDVANFEAYCQSLLDHPQRLDSYYLIFSYMMNPLSAEVTIKDVWLKRVWEICAPSAEWPVKFQIKKGTIYNIRPAPWYSRRTQFKPFASRRAFVEALAVCIKRYKDTNHLHRAGWLQAVESGYQRAAGHVL